jgi:hypothetical protein
MDNRMELDNQTREKLESILERDASTLSQSEIDFLHARESYLSEQEKLRVFVEIKEAEIVDEEEDLKQEEELEQTDEEVVRGSSETGTAPAEVKKYPSKMNKEELIALATEKGLVVPEGATKAEIIELVK